MPDLKDYFLHVEDVLQEEFGLSVDDFDSQDITASAMTGESPEYCARSLAEAA